MATQVPLTRRDTVDPHRQHSLLLRWLGYAGLLLTLALAPSQGMAASKADDLVQQGLAAESRFDPKQALLLFQQADALRPNDPFILQRISRQYSDATTLTTQPDEKRRLAESALSYSLRAYELQPRNPVNVLSLAICYGKLGLYGDTETKVANARLIKQYAEEALALNPDYDWAHHVLGRWHYEVAELGGTKRLVVRLFYGGLPRASVEEAIRHLERAVQLAPEAVGHHIELGFAYLAAARPANARTAFNQGLTLPDKEIHDSTAKRRAREALAKL
ncbi:MAG: hypothetical protein JNN01_04495 [Opitutaceae bacterium]|nr:hypothetical protein [Opitutaceae bacterium]